MKKLLIVLLASVFAASTVFANVELGLNVPVFTTTSSSLYVNRDDTSADYTAKSFGLAGNDFNFYFGSPAFMDIGLNLNYGLTSLADENMKIKDGRSFSTKNTGMGMYFGIGPSIRFNLGDRHAFTFALGGSADFSLPFKENGFAAYNFGTYTDLGYRFWFLNLNGFHMGLGVGVNLSFPGLGNVTWQGSHDLDDFGHSKIGGKTNGGLRTAFKIGLVFNFGDRGYDKHNGSSSKSDDSANVVSSADAADYVGKWTPFEDKNKKAFGYIELNEDGTGYFQYAPDGKNTVADGSLNWELIEKNGKTFIKFSNNKLKDVNKEWECTLSDGMLTFKKALCFGVYPNNKWTK